MFKARLARFYAWSDDLICSMDYETALEYFACIEHLRAEEQMLRFESSDYPHLVAHDRSKVFQKHNSMRYNPKVYTSEELEDFLKVKGLI